MRFFAALAGLVVLAWLLLFGGLWQAMAPAPQTVEAERRVLKTRTTTSSDDGTTSDTTPEGPFRVVGRVLASSGAPLPGISILWVASIEPSADGPASIGQTGADGRFSVDLPESGLVFPEVDATPEQVHISSDRSDVEFVALERCPLEVLVYGPDGTVVVDQPVRASVQVTGRANRPYRIATTNTEGIAALSDMPCGVADIWVRRAGVPQGRRDNVDTLVEQRIVIRLVDGVAIQGTVTDAAGTPIEHARVSAGNASDRTNDEGEYGLLVNPRELSRVQASADGYTSVTERLRVDEDGADDTLIELDFVLESTRVVTVYCAGLPDDSCETVTPLMCTSRLLPMGEECRGTPTECTCPDGNAAIRGGGMAVEVTADDAEVWMDFRNRGGMRGRVTVAGRPVNPSIGRCMVVATRLPEGLEDISGGLSAGAKTSCLPDGNYELLGLKAGTYMIMVHSAAGQSDKPNIQVDHDITEVATIDIGGGGRIEGVVLDGVTGEGVPGKAVLAYAAEGETLNGIGQTVSQTEGRFAITGLDDGRYKVILATRPFHTVSVEIIDGGAAPIELTTGEAGLVQQNGFTLETDDEGLLVVGTVDPEGSAASNGLQEGDVVRGVSMAGMNINDVMPSMSDEITDAVLDHWGGPGVSLVVERDGEEVLVGMD